MLSKNKSIENNHCIKYDNGMQIFEKLNSNPDLSICLGFFDGVHQGHKVVLKNTVNLAKQNGLKSAVITFKEHPLCYLQNRTPQYIVSLKDRLNLIEEQGIDFAYVLDFDEDIADALALDYLKDFLVKNLHPKFITTGFNHYFGANKQGDAVFLGAYQSEFGYKFFEIPPITFNNTLISSSKIRQMITDGNVESVPELLGQSFYIKGRVVTGNRIGRTLSFPTANVKYPSDIIKAARGVYAGIVEFDGGKYNAMLNLGRRPTINTEHSLLLEAHIFDFNQNIYDKDIKVSFVKKIRNEVKFDSLSELKSQLVNDEQTVRKYFETR